MITKPDDLIGPLPKSYYKELLAFVREIDAAKDEIRRECILPNGKLALAIAPQSPCWWGFYELRLLQTVAFLAKVMGLAESMRMAIGTENPNRALMDSLRGDVDGELQDAESLDKGAMALFIGALLSLINSIDAYRYYGQTMDQLMEKVGEGKEAALRKAVSIDPMAIATRAGAAILASKALAGDRKYGSKLLMAEVPAKRRGNRNLRFLFGVLREVGALKRLSAARLVDLVCGTLNLYTPCADAGKNLKEQFRRFGRDATT